MSSIDEVSQKLGGFEASIKTISDDVKKILEAQEEHNKDLILHGVNIDSARNRLDMLEPKVSEHESLKDKAKGAIILSSSIGGGITVIALAVAQWFVRAVF